MKVLIVDDEAMICEWLQFCIAQNPSCRLTGVAHNGREALELFQQNEADLVLTDIKMPVMDGLELLHALRALSERVRVVMLTAFADFDLARRALREGASEYLLKTEMQNEALQELLGRMARQLSVSEGAENPASTGQVHSIIRKILRSERELTDDEMAELRQCGVRWRDNGLFALAVWQRELLQGGLAFPQSNQARHVAGFDYSDRIYLVVGNFPRALSGGEKARQLTEYARQVQQANGCMVGVSAITDEMRQIPLMIRQAVCALGQGFYRGEKRLYEPQYPLAELGRQSRAWKSALAGLRVRLYQTAAGRRCELVREFLQSSLREPILDVELLCKLMSDIFDLFVMEARESGAPMEDADELRAKLMQSVSMQEASAILLEAAARSAPADMPARPRSKNIRLAVEFIRAHYAEPLSLEQVATQVYLNPEYFSRAFKEEMGQNFVNYLTDVRLQHSVQLLETTALRVQNIAQAVGYSNVSYFSTTFKKKYGMSPYEYRRKGV